MKKGVLIALVLLLFVAPSVLALPIEDFAKQVQRGVFYAQNFESGNADYNYAKIIVYFYSVKEEMNSLLKIHGDNAITPEDLKKILGEPDYTYWVSDYDEENEYSTENPVPQWIGRIIFDGEKIQAKLSVTPYQNDLGEISYRTDLFFVLKQDVSIKNVKEKLSEVKTLAKTYVLSINDEEAALLSGNELCEGAVNLETISKGVIEQSDSPMDAMIEIFGEEGKVKEETVATKTFEIFKNEDKKVTGVVSTCEECKSVGGEKMWIKLELKIFNDKGTEIGYFLEDRPTGQYAEMSLNELKKNFIEQHTLLKEQLQNKEYYEAYNTMHEMEQISKYLSKKLNQGEKSEIVRNYVEILDFFVSDSGIFGGYPLIKTNFYTETKFQMPIYIIYENDSEETCDNGIDDNGNSEIDCEEEFCSGQICGSTTEGNDTISLYCIAGECVKKEDRKGSVCGNDVCETGEEDTCESDCESTCPEYEPLNCAGKIFSPGTDENGCPLPPTCIKGENVCAKDSDCTQPLCGKSQCTVPAGESIGKCELTMLEQCSQPECVDGETKICKGSEKEIITHLCELGRWKATGELCPKVVANKVESNPEEISGQASSLDSQATQQPVVKETSTSTLLTKSAGVQCPSGEIWASTKGCTPSITNSQIAKSTESIGTTKGISLTGNIIDVGEFGKRATLTGDVTGESITGTGITGIVAPEKGEKGKVTSLPPLRTYDEGKVSTFGMTGVGRISPEEEIAFVPEKETLEKGIMGDRNLPSGVSDAFILEGEVRTDSKEQKGVLYFTASGMDVFGPVSPLLDKYRENGAESASHDLEEARYKNKLLAESFNDDFVDFYNKFLLSFNGDLSTKRNALYEIYNKNFELKKDIAEQMNRLNIVSIDWTADEIMNIEKDTDLVDLSASETINSYRPSAGAEEVQIPIMSMEASIYFPLDYVKNIFKIAMDGNKFVSSNTYRKYNYGITDDEKNKFQKDAELKEKVRELVSQTADGSFDMHISFYSPNKETGEREFIYGIYVSLMDPDKPNPIRITPMNPADAPPGMDRKVEVNFDKAYELLKEVDSRFAKETRHPEWDKKFRPAEEVEKLIDYISLRRKLGQFEDSIEIKPSDDKTKEVLTDFFSLWGNPGKPSDVKE